MLICCRWLLSRQLSCKNSTYHTQIRKTEREREVRRYTLPQCYITRVGGVASSKFVAFCTDLCATETPFHTHLYKTVQCTMYSHQHGKYRHRHNFMLEEIFGGVEG